MYTLFTGALNSNEISSKILKTSHLGGGAGGLDGKLATVGKDRRIFGWAVMPRAALAVLGRWDGGGIGLSKEELLITGCWESLNSDRES